LLDSSHILFYVLMDASISALCDGRLHLCLM
jgi:hypothetical protein